MEGRFQGENYHYEKKPSFANYDSILPNSKIFNINCFLLCKVLAFSLAVFKSFNCLVLFMCISLF